MRYLILGSSGQVGAGVLEYLKKTEHEAIEFDFVRDQEEDLRIANNAKLEEAVQKADFIFFLAFDVGGARYLRKYQETYDFMSNNLKIMANTFDIIKKYNKPFIFASSQMSNMTFSTYGLLKNVGERVTESLGGLIVKFWNIYGFERDFEKSHVITDLILKAHKTGKVDLITDGQEERQFLHVEDCARCLLILSEKYLEISRDQPLHISSFEWIKVIDVAHTISKNFQNAEVIPATGLDSLKNNVHHSVRNEPSQYILHFWKPTITIEDGIKDIISQMKENNTLN